MTVCRAVSSLTAVIEPLAKKEPPAVSRRGLVVQPNFTLIRRSGIEVAMDAHFSNPRALVAERANRDRLRTAAEGRGGSPLRRRQIRIDDVETDIGLRIDVPLGTG